MKKRNRSSSLIQKLLNKLKRIYRRKPEPEDPVDPHAYRTAPLKRPPHGRSGAAVAELDES